MHRRKKRQKHTHSFEHFITSLSISAPLMTNLVSSAIHLGSISTLLVSRDGHKKTKITVKKYNVLGYQSPLHQPPISSAPDSNHLRSTAHSPLHLSSRLTSTKRVKQFCMTWIYILSISAHTPTDRRSYTNRSLLIAAPGKRLWPHPHRHAWS